MEPVEQQCGYGIMAGLEYGLGYDNMEELLASITSSNEQFSTSEIINDYQNVSLSNQNTTFNTTNPCSYTTAVPSITQTVVSSNTQPTQTPQRNGAINTSSSSSYKSRTQMRQELERMKAAEEDRRDQKRNEENGRLKRNVACPQSVPSSSATTFKSDHQLHSSTSNLSNQSNGGGLLEHPTALHMRLTQERQSKEFLNINSGSVPPLVGSSSSFIRTSNSAYHLSRFQHLSAGGGGATSAPAAVELNIPSSAQYDLVVSPSPGTYSSLVSSVTSAGSIGEPVNPEIIKSIFTYDHDTEKLTNDLDSLNCRETRESAPTTPSTRTRSSTSKLAHDDPKRIAKDRQRKDNHNQIERKRRFNINDRITELGKMLPKEGEPYHKEVGEFRFHKGNILKATVDYIKLLRDENDQLQQRNRETSRENKKLLLLLKNYEELLAQNHISIPEETLAWRRFDRTNDELSNIFGSSVEIKQEPLFLNTGESPNSHPHLLICDAEEDLLFENLDLENDPMLSQGCLQTNQQEQQQQLNHHRMMDF